MKNIDKGILKDIGISVLIVVAIILIILVVCYNKISIGRVIPNIESYDLSDEMKNEIESEQTDENSEIVTTYELDASDLKEYEKTKEYNKGKKNPFAAEQTTTGKDNNNTTDNNSTVDDQSNSSSENFYRDEGIK